MPSNARRRPPAKNATEARQPGYDDVSVFRRHFTSQAGLSPSAYGRTFGQRQITPLRTAADVRDPDLAAPPKADTCTPKVDQR
jgi:hypothetical protein